MSHPAVLEAAVVGGPIRVGEWWSPSGEASQPGGDAEAVIDIAATPWFKAPARRAFHRRAAEAAHGKVEN